MPYAIDAACCENIVQYIHDQEEVVRKLEEIRANLPAADKRSFRQLMADNGLGTAAVAGGGMSATAAAKAPCYGEAVMEIESTHAVNVVQAFQLVLIGGRGYWAPWNWIFAQPNFAHNNWIMTRLAIEIIRAKWLLAKLKKIRDLCIEQKFLSTPSNGGGD